MLNLDNLQSIYTDPDAERGLLAAIARTPQVYWDLKGTLPAGAFQTEGETWAAVAAACEARTAPSIPAEWEAAPEPAETARTLVDLFHRRGIAAIGDRVTDALKRQDRPATELFAGIEETVRRESLAFQDTDGGRMERSEDVLTRTLGNLGQRIEHYKQTGQRWMGLRTGFSRVDSILGGLECGLYLMGAGPGVGKTTTAFQWAWNISKQGTPALYVTYENSPENLCVKALAALSGKDLRAIQDGLVGTDVLWKAAQQWREISRRLAFIVGTSKLTVAQIRGRALELMNQHQAKQIFICVDYLQAAAKSSEELRKMGTIREKVETFGGQLRAELAVPLNSPVLAISSQSRLGGDYGDGNGKARLDSLKESGDLEYQADVVLFLTDNKPRYTVPPARPVKLSVVKSRNGDVCKDGVNLVFRPDIATVREEAAGQ